MDLKGLDTFTRAYIECALWSSLDDNDQPLDRDHSADDISEELASRILADCAKFQADHGDVIGLGDEDRAGHDFWLTRNGHGAGFWDGDWPEPAATRLTDASKRFGETDWTIGDDGKLY